MEINKRFDIGQSAVANLKKKDWDIAWNKREFKSRWIYKKRQCSSYNFKGVPTVQYSLYANGGWVEGVVTGNSLLWSNWRREKEAASLYKETEMSVSENKLGTQAKINVM